MQPRPLYRWKSFWLGVLALAFLGWAWVDSMGAKTSLLFGVSKYFVIAQHHTGMIEFEWISSLPASPLEWKWGRQTLPPNLTFPWFPYFATWKKNAFFFLAGFAHWLLILLFLAAWTAFLSWRWRRMRRSTAVPPLD